MDHDLLAECTYLLGIHIWKKYLQLSESKGSGVKSTFPFELKWDKVTENGNSHAKYKHFKM